MTEKTTISLGPPRTGPEAQESRVIARYGTAAAATGADIQTIVDTAKRMRDSRLMPQHIQSAEAAVIIGLRGAELGLPLIQAWHSMYVINGRAAMEAKTMVALAYKILPGFDFTILKLNRTECVAKARRSRDHSWVEMTYDMEDAKAAGLTGKGPWKQHPKAMLLARCQAMLMRAVAPDTFQGLYTGEEIQQGLHIEEGDPSEVVTGEDIPEAEWSETDAADEEPADPIDAMTREQIVEAITDGGLQADARKARVALELAEKDNSVHALRAIYRHITKQMDGEE